MIAFSLIITVCMLNSPTTCRDEEPSIYQNYGTESNPIMMPMSYVACQHTDGEKTAYAWIDEHPKWILKKWTCELHPAGERSL